MRILLEKTWQCLSERLIERTKLWGNKFCVVAETNKDEKQQARFGMWNMKRTSWLYHHRMTSFSCHTLQQRDPPPEDLLDAVHHVFFWWILNGVYLEWVIYGGCAILIVLQAERAHVPLITQRVIIHFVAVCVVVSVVIGHPLDDWPCWQQSVSQREVMSSELQTLKNRVMPNWSLYLLTARCWELPARFASYYNKSAGE